MKEARFLALVDETKCIGCDICQNVCPTAAIVLVNKKAKVHEDECVACCNCWNSCPTDAIRLVARPEPVTFGLDPAEADQTMLTELCIKAHLHPRQYICLCTRTRADEAAAAVLNGARSPEEIALMTGARSGCTLYCLEPMLRLLKAHGVEVTPPEGYHWYNIAPTLWDIPEEVKRKYPGYYFEEDKEVFKKI
jgi:Fe-S-cluster-containing hydrogenase component 2